MCCFYWTTLFKWHREMHYKCFHKKWIHRTHKPREDCLPMVLRIIPQRKQAVSPVKALMLQINPGRSQLAGWPCSFPDLNSLWSSVLRGWCPRRVCSDAPRHTTQILLKPQKWIWGLESKILLQWTQQQLPQVFGCTWGNSLNSLA